MDNAQIPDEKLPNTRLQHERELKGWSQEHVAKEIDTSAKNISRWECGDKPIPYYRQKLCALFSKNAEDLGFLDTESSNDNGPQEENREAASSSQEESVSVRDTVSNDPSSNQSIQFFIPQSLVHSSSSIHITVSSSPTLVSLQECGERLVRVDEPVQNNAYFQQGATPLPVATSQLGAPVDRRDFLRETGHVAVGLLGAELLDRFYRALKKPSTLDERTLDYFELRTEGYWQDRHSAALASSDLLSYVIEHLEKIVRLLEGSMLPTVRTRLCSIASKTSLLIGELLLDMSFYARAREFQRSALTAAQEINSQALEAISCGRLSLAWTYSKNAPNALTYVQEARHLAVRSSTPLVDAWLAAIEAEAQVNLHNWDGCLKALDEAEYREDQHDSAEDDYLIYFDRALLEGYQGVCYRRLYRPDNTQSIMYLEEAQKVLMDALARLDAKRIQRKPTFLTDLADTYVRQGEIEGACVQAIQAVKIADQMKLQKVLQRLFALRQELEPWKDTQHVKNLDKHLAPLVILNGQH